MTVERLRMAVGSRPETGSTQVLLAVIRVPSAVRAAISFAVVIEKAIVAVPTVLAVLVVIPINHQKPPRSQLSHPKPASP